MSNAAALRRADEDRAWPDRFDQELRDALARMRDDGLRLVDTNARWFRDRLEQAERAAAGADLEKALVAAQAASVSAQFWHPGQFASARLDGLLRRIGARLGPSAARDRPPPSRVERVLHLVTYANTIGGHTRLVRRWIEADRHRSHSVAVTHQFEPVPADLAAAVGATGGRLHLLNRGLGGLAGTARRLRALAGGFDLVLLHSHTFDIVPIVALAGRAGGPPLVVVDHIDHQFWPGATQADLVVALRDAGRAMALGRRHVAPERSALLPIPLDPPARGPSRAEAKLALGLPADSVLLLTIARAVKFVPLGEHGFADVHVPVLRRHPRARLVAIGPGGRVDWSAAEAIVPGRVVALPETDATATWYAAADLYLDSFPFNSNTSLLEAGSHGIPLVGYSPLGEDPPVIAAGAPGLDGTLVRSRSAGAYAQLLDELIGDAGARDRLGRMTAARIGARHRGPGWAEALEEVYRQALAVPPLPPATDAGPDRLEDPEARTDLDTYMSPVYGRAYVGMDERQRGDVLDELHLRYLPPLERIWRWNDLRRRDAFRLRGRGDAWRHLLPEWLAARARAAVGARAGRS